MDNFKLSERLKKVAHLINKGNTIADIGTDHGYLPIYIIKQNISNHVIGMDLRKGPLQKAKDNIRLFNVNDKVELRLSDGLDKLESGEADTVTICGMGGKLIQSILTKGKDKLSCDTQLIVSPQSEIAEFREFLQKNGYLTVSEYMLKEEGQFYLIIECRINKNSDINENVFDDMQRSTYYKYGRQLLEEKNECLHEYLLKEKQINESVYNKVISLEVNDGVKKRLEQLQADRKCIKYALSFYE